MARKKLFWQLFQSYLLLIISVFILIAFVVSLFFRNFYYDETAESLRVQIALIKDELVEVLDRGAAEELQLRLLKMSERSGARFTIVDEYGKVLADSSRAPSELDNHSERPEIVAAVSGKLGRAIRYSQTVNENLMYVADQATNSVGEPFIVRAAIPMLSLKPRLQKVNFNILVGLLCILILVGFLSMLVSKRLSRPLELVKLQAKKLGQGHFSERISLGKDSPKELYELAEVVDAVAVDLNKLESHRKEFVANVSHELRTPLTSIQGFTETLMNPQVQDPDERKKFVEIIHKHAARLSAIIEDLLLLSQTEQGVDEGGVERVSSRLSPILEAAASVCRSKAETRGISIAVEGDPEIEAPVNASLLEQAVVNLLDNAVKYSGEKKAVRVSLDASGDEVIIAVSDRGKGIPEKHLDRLFERFYRVDKARSREVGGTGLGLAIVKHIALAHDGKVSVNSQMGEGSTFRIHISRSIKD